MRYLSIASIAIAAMGATCQVLGQTADVNIKIAPVHDTYPNVESIVLKITIQNTTDNVVAFETTTLDPPINLLILDERGRTWIIDGPRTNVKDGTTRSRMFRLEPNETRVYERHPGELLRRDQSFAHLGPAELSIEAVIPRLYYENGRSGATLIRSNTCKVSLTP